MRKAESSCPKSAIFLFTIHRPFCLICLSSISFPLFDLFISTNTNQHPQVRKTDSSNPGLGIFLFLYCFTFALLYLSLPNPAIFLVRAIYIVQCLMANIDFVIFFFFHRWCMPWLLSAVSGRPCHFSGPIIAPSVQGQITSTIRLNCRLKTYLCCIEEMVLHLQNTRSWIRCELEFDPDCTLEAYSSIWLDLYCGI